MRFIGAVVALVSIGAMTIVGPALALDRGVHVDPNSPAGKEYSFPLDVRRAAAVGHNAPQDVTQPLFGVGIGAAVGGANGNGAPATATAGRKSAAATTTAGGKPAAAPAGSRPVRSSRSDSAARRGSSAVASRGRSSQHSQIALLGLSRPRATTSQVALILVPMVLAGLLAGVAIIIARRRRA